MSLTRAIDAAGSALSAERLRMELASANMANAQTTRTPEGGPYKRKTAVFEAEPALLSSREERSGRTPGGVRASRIVTDPSPPEMRYEPNHPDANAEGYVAYPAINATAEMVDLVSAARSYEAGVTVIRTVRQLMQTTLNLVR
jgi:flagellar basal-body rod protein FlgC